MSLTLARRLLRHGHGDDPLGGSAKQISTVVLPNGQVEAVYVGTDAGIWRKWRTPDGQWRGDDLFTPHKLSSDGVIAIEESYEVSANVFSPVDQRKKALPMIAFEPRTLELIRRHRRYLMQRSHPGLKTELVFPSESRALSATTRSTTFGGRRR